MKVVLVVFFAFSCLLLEINGWCRLMNASGPNATHCEWNGTRLELGETKEINCLTTTCELDGRIAQCENYGYYHGYPERCTAIKVGCRPKLVMKDDNSVDCDLQPHETFVILG